MDDKNFIGLYECLGKDPCESIIKSFENSLKITVRNYGNPESSGTMDRLDQILFVNSTDSFVADLIQPALREAFELYRKEYPNIDACLQIASDEIKLQKTEPRGGFHKWHCEQGRAANSRRVLAWTLYLNDIPKGEGETEFLHQGVRIEPKAGNISIWPAAFTHVHRGNPVYSCDKYIATGWFSLIK